MELVSVISSPQFCDFLSKNFISFKIYIIIQISKRGCFAKNFVTELVKANTNEMRSTNVRDIDNDNNNDLDQVYSFPIKCKSAFEF